MIDLIKIGDKTFYLKNPVNVGIYLLDDNNVCLIDSGNSKDFGKIIDKILKEHNWNLKHIINTHSHADHIGGNKFLQDKYNCKIYANKVESYFINEPFLEPSFLYGATPLTELCNTFLMAEKSECEDIKNLTLEGITIINLEGHSFGHIGVVTSDGVCFVGDAFTSGKTLNKYSIQYIYDVEKYLVTLEKLEKTNYKLYVPAHGKIENDPKQTIFENKQNTLAIETKILEVIDQKISFSNLLKKIFEIYQINMNSIQYHLIGATLKAFLTKLVRNKVIEITFENDTMILKKII